MANIYIQEFSSAAAQWGGAGQLTVVNWPPIANQKVAFGSPSNPLSGATRIVRITADAICSFIVTKGAPGVGVTPAAAVTDTRLNAGAVEYLAVLPGSVIASISNT